MFDCDAGMDSCNCHCHSNPGTKHFMACCFICPICSRNIRASAYTMHVERHNNASESDMVQ